MKKCILIAVLIMFLPACFTKLMAQVTIGALNSPDPSAVLDLHYSTTRGLFLPLVELKQTTDYFPLQNHHVAGMIVYNTTLADPPTNDVSPGFYYNDGSRWVRILNETDKPTTPFRTVVESDATLSLSDAGGIVEIKSASIDRTVTVPSSLPKGFTCIIYQIDAGHIIISGDAAKPAAGDPGMKSRTKFSGIGVMVGSANVIVTGDTTP